MINLYVLNFKLLSLLIGFAAFITAILYYLQFKKPSAKYFGGFILGLFLLHIGALASYLHNYIPNFSNLVGYNFIILLVYPCYFFISFYGTKFTLSLFGKKMTNWVQVIFISYYIIQGTLAHYGFKYAMHPYDLIPCSFASFFMISYIILNFKNIVDRFLKRSVLLFLIVSAIFIPTLSLFFIEKYYFVISSITFIYFFLISIGAIFFASTFFTRKPYMVKGEPTNTFKNKFCISDREMDVITLILKGLTAKSIGESLNISTRTVTTHTSNIYNKVNVNSRVQLINLFGSNWSK